MEVWNLYNAKGQVLDQTMIRGQLQPTDTYHLVVHIIVKNSKGDYLIQKRSDRKESLPSIWAFTGGAALVGESSEEAAIRELSEETGIFLSANNMIFENRSIRKDQLADIWSALVDVDVSTLDFQVEEVSALDFKSKDEILMMIDQGIFHTYDEVYLRRVFNI